MTPEQTSLTPSPVNYPVSLEVMYPERSSRFLALLTIFFFIPKAFLLIPHAVALWILGMISFLCVVLGQFAVLFTGKYPRAFFDLNVGVLRWKARVSAYLFGLTDSYPPFHLNN